MCHKSMISLKCANLILLFFFLLCHQKMTGFGDRPIPDPNFQYSQEPGSTKWPWGQRRAIGTEFTDTGFKVCHRPSLQGCTDGIHRFSMENKTELEGADECTTVCVCVWTFLSQICLQKWCMGVLDPLCPISLVKDGMITHAGTMKRILTAAPKFGRGKTFEPWKWNFSLGMRRKQLIRSWGSILDAEFQAAEGFIHFLVFHCFVNTVFSVLLKVIDLRNGFCIIVKLCLH